LLTTTVVVDLFPGAEGVPLCQQLGPAVLQVFPPGVPSAPAAYAGLVTGIADLLEQARRGAARTVNAILTATYWEIGRRIVEFEQAGKARAESA
jgi:hypothetical protein